MTTKPARHYQPWTAEDDALLSELYAIIPNAEIAQRLQRTVPTIYARIKYLRLTEASTACWRCGAPIDQPAVGRRRRYCRPDTECARDRGLELDHERDPLLPIVDKNCEQCGNPFQGYETRRFCSRQCGRRNYYERQKAFVSGSITDPVLRREVFMALRRGGKPLRQIAREVGVDFANVRRLNEKLKELTS